MGERQEAGKENWLLIKEKDEEARSGKKRDDTDLFTASVASGKSIEQIAMETHAVWQSHRPSKKSSRTALDATPCTRSSRSRSSQSPFRKMDRSATGDLGDGLTRRRGMGA